MNIWRIQTNTSKRDISKYCLDNNIVAMGWSLLEYNGDLQNLAFEKFEDYCDFADMYYQKYDSVIRLAKYISENDIIWMRSNGLYYCARITSDSKWIFNIDKEARQNDASNQLTNINWIKVGDESVPGALATAFIQGKTLQRITKPGIQEFSKIIYDNLSKDAFKYNESIELSMETFYNLISPSDCEDLLYSYLYFKNNKNYMCIPSTNKIGTEKYEFVILDTETGEHIYIQVKNGNRNLNADDYINLVKGTNNQVYLFSSSGKVINTEKYSNIKAIKAEELYEFACDEKNQNYIPPNIDFWMQFAGSASLHNNSEKGIIFDTNNDNCESYMFNKYVVAAWGNPKKYIKSFNINDYVLYYRKGTGIISIGKVISNSPSEIDAGLELQVQIIVDRKYDCLGNIISVKASELKKFLNKSFYFASTRKVPFLSKQEVDIISNILLEKQEKLSK